MRLLSETLLLASRFAAVLFATGRIRRNPAAAGRSADTFYFETHSLPAFARCYPRNFAFYVANPDCSILLSLFSLWHHSDLLREGDEARIVLVGAQERIQ
jgi:hypothetical protein